MPRHEHRTAVLHPRLTRFVVATATTLTVFIVATFWLHDLAFERTAVLGGEYWRLATSHLTHLDTKHALLNAVGVGLLAAILLDFFRLRTILVSVGAIAAVVSTASLLLSVQSSYAGFSGVLYGLAAIVAMALAKRSPWLAAAVAILLVLGVATALAGWSRPWTADVAIHTHVSGILAGAGIGAWLRRSEAR